VLNQQGHCSLSVCGAVWHTGARKESELGLEDDDGFTQPIDGWKRVNTLAHYNVQDHSDIHLVYDSDRTNNVADGEPHVVVNADGTTSIISSLLCNQLFQLLLFTGYHTPVFISAHISSPNINNCLRRRREHCYRPKA